MTLEDQLMDDMRRGIDVDIERALLIVSGCDTEEKIAEYRKKIDEIEKDFKAYNGIFPFFERRKKKVIARNLHEYFWGAKPKRYNGNFLLTDVIDAQLSPEPNPVGNCLGLTSLYTVIGLRQGLDINVLALTNHVASIVKAGKENIAVENVKPDGFGKKEIIPDPGHAFVGIYSLKSLITMALINKGVDKEIIKKDLMGAFADHSMAIEINPKLPNAYNSRALALESMGSTLMAMEDYARAIELCPKYAMPYKNRAELKLNLKDMCGAIEDLNEALAINPKFADAYRVRGRIRYKLRDVKGAEEDFEMFSRLRKTR
ncbi:MAG: hypothetical protein PHO02_04010 [Candidatus Nanoarchaeia archaeon]|nr:hypothetical protein [Candidatus Nanoarchaeia archaeon]